MSDGLKCRVVFAWISSQNPNLLLLDEPTNHLDIETIDSLAEAINEFNGGMMLVSHDFRLINQVLNIFKMITDRDKSKIKGSSVDTIVPELQEKMGENY